MATLRSAELGFLGVRVMTCTQTPRRCGQFANAGDFADALLPVVKARLDALPRSSWEGFPTYIHVDDIDALFGNDRTPNGGAS